MVERDTVRKYPESHIPQLLSLAKPMPQGHFSFITTQDVMYSLNAGLAPVHHLLGMKLLLLYVGRNDTVRLLDFQHPEMDQM